MQLQTILTVLAAVLAIVSAAPAPIPAVDITAVPPGTRLSKSVVDINESENEELNDENSKIIVFPAGGGPPTIIIQPSPQGPILLRHPLKRSDVDGAENDHFKMIIYPSGGGGGYPSPPYYPGGSRPPVIIIISPYGSRGPGGGGGGILLKRPRKRSDVDDAENDHSKMIIYPSGGGGGYPGPPYYPGGSRPPVIIIISPYGSRVEVSNVLILSTLGSTSVFPSGRPFPKRDDDDEASKVVYYKPGVGYYPPPTLYGKRDKAEAENEAVGWENEDSFAE
ncbi:hypothetical protein BGZ90_007462 [Linnemannia elongata]|nr:hypothetical protein BGZ90_007462 [Linnemannia elongata]